MDNNVDNIVAKTVHTKPGLLKQGALITQLCMPQDVNILQVSENFGKASSRKDKLFSSFTRVKSSPRLPPNIVPLDYFTINSSNISNDWVKQEEPKARTIEVHKRDVKQITLLGKLKYGSSV